MGGTKLSRSSIHAAFIACDELAVRPTTVIIESIKPMVIHSSRCARRSFASLSGGSL